MDMKEEVMGDAIDDALGDAGDEEETDQIVNQVKKREKREFWLKKLII